MSPSGWTSGEITDFIFVNKLLLRFDRLIGQSALCNLTVKDNQSGEEREREECIEAYRCLSEVIRWFVS